MIIDASDQDCLGLVRDPGIHVWAFRHQRHPGAGWETIENSRNRRLRAPKSAGGQISKLVVRNPRHVKEELIFLPGKRQFLQLPLVYLDIGLSNLIEEAVIAGEARNLPGKFRGPYTLGAFARIRILPPGFRMCWAAVRPLMVW
jgi:hypothetical protein